VDLVVGLIRDAPWHAALGVLHSVGAAHDLWRAALDCSRDAFVAPLDVLRQLQYGRRGLVELSAAFRMRDERAFALAGILSRLPVGGSAPRDLQRKASNAARTLLRERADLAPKK